MMQRNAFFFLPLLKLININAKTPIFNLKKVFLTEEKVRNHTNRW